MKPIIIATILSVNIWATAAETSFVEQTYSQMVQSNGIAISLVLDTNRFATSQQIFLGSALKNIGTNRTEVFFASVDARFRFEVAGPNQKAVPRTLYGQHKMSTFDIGPQPFIRMEPGESRSDIIPLSRMFDMTMPGEYRIKVTRYVCTRPDGRMDITFQEMGVSIPFWNEQK